MKPSEMPPTSPISSADRPKERLKPNWVDSALTGFSPMLIVGMICCLVFFLVTVIYSGNFTIRLMYIFGLYTFASVFTARIAIEQSRTLATTYASILGVATLIVTMRFVQFSGALAPFSVPATIGFLVLIAYLADRITHDCTVIDDSSDGANEGLLQSLGLVPSGVTVSDRKQRSTEQLVSLDAPETGPNPIVKTKIAKRKRHNPGVWVLYFAFLAIPLFGMGQIMIPSWDRVRNQLAFVFLVGYLYCTLSLLIVTSLLGLRRYLRRRQIEMPLGLTSVWFFSGIVGVVTILGILSLISLPSGNTGLFSLPFTITSPEGIKASPHGWGPEGVPTEKPQENNDANRQVAQQEKQNDAPKQEKSDNTGPGKEEDTAEGNGKKASGSGNQKAGESKGDSDNKSESKSDSPQPEKENQSDRKDPTAAKDANSKTPSDTKNNPGENIQNENAPAEEKQRDDLVEPKNKQPPAKSPAKPTDKSNVTPNEKPVDKPNEKPSEKPSEKPAEKPVEKPQSSSSNSWSIALSGGLADLFRWLLMVALAIFVVYCVVRYRADLADAWQNFLQTLFGFFNIPTGTRQQSLEDSESTTDTSRVRNNLFADFADPFQTNPSVWTPPKIVSHTFEAIQAWGSERNLPRLMNETAEEYLSRLARRYPVQSESFQRLTGLYNRLAYAAKSVDQSESNKLASLWNWMRNATA